MTIRALACRISPAMFLLDIDSNMVLIGYSFSRGGFAMRIDWGWIEKRQIELAVLDDLLHASVRFPCARWKLNLVSILF